MTQELEPNNSSTDAPRKDEPVRQAPQQEGSSDTPSGASQQPLLDADNWGDDDDASASQSPSEDVSVSEDFKVNYPDHIPQEHAKELNETFIKLKIPADTAQALTDTIVAVTEEQEKKYAEKVIQKNRADTQLLKEELGASYARKDAHIRQLIAQSGIEKPELTAFTTEVGKYKAWKFFEKLSHYTTDGDRVSANARNTPASSPKDLEKMMDSPEFSAKLEQKDPEAKSLIRKWAEQQASYQD